MVAQLERFCVVALFERIEAGERFQRSEWPAHVTLASNFRVAGPVEQLVRAVHNTTVVDGPLTFRVGGPVQFGPRRNVPVRLVDSPRVDGMHRDLADHLGRFPGFAADEPAHWRDGYHPHITLRPTFDILEGEIRAASHVAVAKLIGPEAEIVACLEVERPRIAELRAVGFDLDGTLFDHEGSAADAARKFTTELGREPTAERVAAWFELEDTHFERWRVGEVTFAEQRRARLRDFLTLLDVAIPAAEAELDELFDTYLADYRRAWRALPGATVLLQSLRECGTRIGVLTNGNHTQQIDKLNVIGLGPLIDVICTSEDIGYAKPDPRAFEILAARLECATSEMIFIGDNPELDVAAARAAGIAAARVRHGNDSHAALKEALTLAHL